jgi:hypothetical protein
MGTWSLPVTVYQAGELVKVIKDLEKSDIETVMGIEDKLYDVLGDDDLFDEIDAEFQKLGPKLASIVKKHLAAVLREYERDSELFKEDFSPGALHILEEIV